MMDFEIIWKKINASISQEEEEALNNWLVEHEDHRRFFENAKRFYSHGSVLEKEGANVKQAWLKIAESLDKPRTRHKSKFIMALAAAAVVTVLVFAGIYVWLPDNMVETRTTEVQLPIIEPGSDKAILILDDNSTYELSAGKSLSLTAGGSQIKSEGTSLEYKQDKNAPLEVKYNTLKIPRGGEFIITLVDGTKVWLNSETTLRFPVSFIGETREVELIGEAFFDVTKDKRPFLVKSGQQVVEVLGTEFNISAYPEDTETVTTLVEGKVDVFLGKNPGIKQTLTPNFQSSMINGGGRITKQEVDVNEFIAWKEGRFYFRDQSLDQIMKTLSRWYNVDVVFENKQAGNILFTGDIKRHENFKKILELFEKTNEVNFTIEERTIIIK